MNELCEHGKPFCKKCTLPSQEKYQSELSKQFEEEKTEGIKEFERVEKELEKEELDHSRSFLPEKEDLGKPYSLTAMELSIERNYREYIDEAIEKLREDARTEERSRLKRLIEDVLEQGHGGGNWRRLILQTLGSLETNEEK